LIRQGLLFLLHRSKISKALLLVAVQTSSGSLFPILQSNTAFVISYHHFFALNLIGFGQNSITRQAL
jgi:hypothetical protein